MDLNFTWSSMQIYGIIRTILKSRGAIKDIGADGALSGLWDNDRVLTEDDQDLIMTVVGANRWSNCYTSLRVASCPQDLFDKLVLVDKLLSEYKLKGQGKKATAVSTGAKQGKPYKRKNRHLLKKKQDAPHLSNNFVQRHLFCSLKYYQVDFVLTEILAKRMTPGE